jgi:hypothetical protein
MADTGRVRYLKQKILVLINQLIAALKIKEALNKISAGDMYPADFRA